MLLEELILLGRRLEKWLSGEEWQDLDIAVRLAEEKNPYFSSFMLRNSISAIVEEFLNEKKLKQWAQLAPKSESSSVAENRRVGIIMAGNLPLVGFSDLLAVLVSGATPVVKMSSKDSCIFPVLFPSLEYVGDLKSEGLAAVLTMGGSIASAVFKEKYAGIPMLVRDSRYSVGVISGSETDSDLKGLVSDILLYYGMGCRSITRLLVPRDYDFSRLKSFVKNYISENDMLEILRGSYLRNRAVYTMESRDFEDAGGAIFLEDNEFDISPPLAVIIYKYYEDKSEVDEFLAEKSAKIQKVFYTFGVAQKPSLVDYPDGEDVLNFLKDN